MDGRPAWPCEAYGDDGLDIGAWCFVAPEPEHRACQDRVECAERMRLARQHTFRRLNELAASGNEIAVDLSETVPNPDWLLGGPEAPNS